MSETARLVVPRRTGSISDLLEAIGAALVLHQTADVGEEAVRIVQTDAGFEITVQGPATPRRGISPMIPYFKDANVDGPQPTRGEVYDYATDKRRSEEAKAAKTKKARTAKGRGRQRPPVASAIAQLSEEQEDRGTTSPRWLGYNALQSLTKGQFKNDWNSTWQKLDALSADRAATLADSIWNTMRGKTNWTALEAPLSDEVTMLQYLNPIAAKGGNREKPGTVKRDNLKGLRGIEWLKMTAFDRLATLRRVGDDVRLWVPMPVDVSMDALSHAQHRLQEAAWRSGDIKQDALMALDFADGLARHWLTRRSPPGRRANQVVRGVDTVTFQDMGGGFNVMSLAAHGLPGWIVLTDEHALESYLEALDAFRHACRSLDETHSDDISVLSSLRTAIGAEDAPNLLTFFTEYASFVQRRQAATQSFLPFRFATAVLDAVFGGTRAMLIEVVQNDGFRNVATAIRKATVTEQYWKSKHNQVYDIHYGLFAELRRALRRKKDLVARLADFVAAYNAESARVMETGRDRGRRRGRVTDADLDAVLQLVENHGSEIVGSLLCAYGSARSSRDDDAVDATPQNATT